MRNLKKVLSLVLATVMTMGLMMVGANAFSDDASIDNTEAVGVVSTLNIITGYPDGSFKPGKAVSRAEMAKMICVMLNGGEDPIIGVKDVPTYSDVRNSADAWAEEYIEYCTSNGIVSGVGGGKFNPSRAVTGSEAAKMLLVALGYAADITGQEFTGADWKLNVNTIANNTDNKLYAGLSKSVADAPLTRGQAAQMVYNTLNANVVTTSYGKNLETGVYTVSYNVENETMLSNVFNANAYVGVLEATETASVDGTLAATGKIRVNVTAVDNQTVTAYDKSFTVTVDNALLGKEVKVLQHTTRENKSVVLGAPVATDNNNTLTLTAGLDAVADLADALDEAGLDPIANGTAVVTNLGTAIGTADNNDDAYALLGNGVVVTFVNNDAADDAVDYILVTDKEVGKVASYSAKEDGYIAITAISTAAPAFNMSSDDPVDGKGAKKVIGFENVAKDDIVLYYQNTKGNWVVEKCDSKVVTPTAVKGEKATASGVVYAQSALNTADVAKATGTQATLVAALPTTALNKEATFYFDNYGYVVYVGDVKTTTNYMLVTGAKANDDANNAFDELTIKGVLADGTKVTVDVSKYDDVSISKDTFAWTAFNSANLPAIVTYTVNDNGTYELKPITTAGTPAGITKNKVDLGGGVTANKNTIFVIGNSSDAYTVYTGIDNVPSVASLGTDGAYYAVKTSSTDGTAKIVFVTKATLKGDTVNSIYILNDVPTITRKGTTDVYTYDAMMNGELLANGIVVKGTGNNSVQMGLYILATNEPLNSDGSVQASYLSGAEAVERVTACSAGVIKTGSKSLVYDAETVVIVIDADEKAVVAGEHTIDEVVVIASDNANNSKVVLVEGKTNGNVDGTADYVYIIK